jgi:anaerobic selenocysteine-containing dehydrogenase
MQRRDFIKLTAITGTSATLASCGNPELQLIRFIPEDELVPGVAEWKPSVCPLCSAGCGLTVRVMETDAEVVRNGEHGMLKIAAAKKLEGQPDHPINQGGLCPRGQAAIQITYHPDRITGPMKRSGARGANQWKPVSWDEAIAELTSQLDGVAGTPATLACVARPRRSRRLELVAAFLRGFGAPPPILFELFDDYVLRRANTISFGREQMPTLDLARSRYVISFGADFLGTWNSPVAQNAGYGAMRQGHPQQRGTFVQIEARMSPTGASADEWVPVKPGTEGALALGLAHAIVAAELRPEGGAATASALSAYAPEQVERITGVAAKRIERLAHDLVEHGPGMAVVGGPPLAHTNGLFTAVAVNTLNALLGTVGQPGGINFMPQASQPSALISQPSAAGSQRVALGPQPSSTSAKPSVPPFESLANAKVLLIDDANPVFSAPKAWKVRETVEKIPFIVSFGNFVDDTSSFADLLLPDHSFLESWIDGLPEAGAASALTNAAGPVMRPLHDTRATPDVLIEVAGKLKKPVALPWKTFDEMLKASMPEGAWTAAQSKGFAALDNAGQSSQGAPARIGAPRSMTFVEPTFDGDAGTYPFHFLPYASQAFYDGSVAHLPWLQELPDPLTSAMWSSWVEINPSTAQRLSIAQGDLVDVTSTQGTVRAPAVISPGIAPDVIAMPVGQGHEAFTRYATRRGVNPISILAPVTESETGALAWAATRVKIARAGDPDGSLIMFAGEMREHPHEQEKR